MDSKEKPNKSSILDSQESMSFPLKVPIEEIPKPNEGKNTEYKGTDLAAQDWPELKSEATFASWREYSPKHVKSAWQPFTFVDDRNNVMGESEIRAVDGSNLRHAKPAQHYISFEDVHKSYVQGETKIKALDGVNFEIEKGELVIIVGASGSGKSTILNILGGMDSLTSGRILVDGQKVSAFNKKQLVLYRRYDIGFVFQFYNLVQNLTVEENVELATQISNKPLNVGDTLKAVGLKNRARNFPSQLSGGEQQRVAIARALAKNPKLLLCDEPTGALDYNTGKAILQLLQDTAREKGMTVIIVTHNSALTQIGDRVITVRNGKVVSMETNGHPMDIHDVEW